MIYYIIAFMNTAVRLIHKRYRYDIYMLTSNFISPCMGRGVNPLVCNHWNFSVTPRPWGVVVRVCVSFKIFGTTAQSPTISAILDEHRIDYVCIATLVKWWRCWKKLRLKQICKRWLIENFYLYIGTRHLRHPGIVGIVGTPASYIYLASFVRACTLCQ